MRNPFQPGDQKTYRTTVTAAKLARFETGLVHAVYSTFAAGHDAEWACRLFVLEMKEAHEEGVGSRLTVEHVSPAPVGAKLLVTATLQEVQGNRVSCRYSITWGERLIAHGEQEQRVLDKARFQTALDALAEQV